MSVHVCVQVFTTLWVEREKGEREDNRFLDGWDVQSLVRSVEVPPTRIEREVEVRP